MVKKEKGIIVFGKGWYCKSKIRYICEKYTDIYYIDNAKVGKKSERVFEPKDINCLPYYDIVIMSNQHMWNMVSQILELGVDESRIILGMNMEPAVDHLEECMNKRNIKLLVQDGEIVLECRDSRRKIENYCELKKVIFEYSDEKRAITTFLNSIPNEPFSRKFGLEYGTSIARYYINHFIHENSDVIRGVICEVGDDRYTSCYNTHIEDNYILHVKGKGNGKVIELDLTKELPIELESKFDCVICTQTIQMIYDKEYALYNLKKMLRTGGSALLSFSSISQLSESDYSSWGEYWRFSDIAVKDFLLKEFDDDKIRMRPYGNFKAAIALLCGIPAEMIAEKELDYYDKMYQTIITASVEK